VVHVFNKMDLLPEEQRDGVRERVANIVPGSMFVSTAEEGGLEPLRRELLRRVREEKSVLELRIPASDGKTLAELYRSGDVLEQRVEGDEIVVSARLSREVAGRIASRA